MQITKYADFVEGLGKRQKTRKPTQGQIELTHRCNLDCVHCYCKTKQEKRSELTAAQWQHILDQIHREGCLWLTLTGGEPLLRDDFLDIYAYAHKKGFLINVFTNGASLPQEIFKFFKTNPPLSIEISLYGTTKEVYESITQVPGSFEKVKDNIDKLIDIKMPLVLKTVGLKQNKDEILKVKALAERLLGKKKFKFDSFIFPCISADTSPCKHRLTPEEILEIEGNDEDMITQRQEQYHNPVNFKRPSEYLYQCNAWMKTFFINPYGLLQFCHLTEKFSADLTKMSFREGFYNEFPKLLNEKFKTNSGCKTCNLRMSCYFCPARANLEVGNEEGPVEYYCQMARARERQRLLSRRLIHK